MFSQFLWINKGSGGSSSFQTLTGLYSLKHKRGEIHFELTPRLLARFSVWLVVALRLQFLISCWPEATLSSLLREPFHRATRNKTAGFTQVRKERERVLARESLLARQKPRSLVANLGSDSPSFYSILFIRNMSLSSIHTQGERITQEEDSGRQGLLEIISEASSHTIHLYSLEICV